MCAKGVVAGRVGVEVESVEAVGGRQEGEKAVVKRWW